MKVLNDAVITNGAMTGTSVLASEAIYLGNIINWSAQISWTRSSGALTGTWKIQVCNAASINKLNKSEPQDPVWIDLQNATGSVVDAASGNAFINLPDVGYTWGRVVYTNATGVGVLNVRVGGKGV